MIGRLALAILATAALAACDLFAVPDASQEQGAFEVTVELGPDAGMSIGGTRFSFQLTDARGLTMGWEMPWPGGDGGPNMVPVGPYLFEAWTIHSSDAILCKVDPNAPDGTGQRCTRDESSVAKCQLPIVVGGHPLSVRYRFNGDVGVCSADAPPP